MRSRIATVSLARQCLSRSKNPLSRVPQRAKHTNDEVISPIGNHKQRGARFEFVDSPYTGEIVTKARYLPPSEIKEKMKLSHEVQKSWAREPLQRRMDLITKVIQAIEHNRDEIAKNITQEMGKPIKQAQGEIDTMIKRMKGMLDIAPSALADVVIEETLGKHTGNEDLFHHLPNHMEMSTDTAAVLGKNPNILMKSPTEGCYKTRPPYASSAMSDDTYVFDRRLIRQPVGIVAVVAPWNYPLLTSISALVPGVIAGNSVVLKPSPRTPGSAKWIEKCFIEAGAPEGLVQSLFVATEDFAGSVVTDPHVGYVSFTGSVSGGRTLHRTVAEKRFIQVGLELGGKDALYVAEDCDFKTAMDNIVEGTLCNAGQTCCAVERILVHKSLYKKVCDALLPAVKDFVVIGDPLSEKTTFGPLALPTAARDIAEKVEDAVKQGAKLVTGGTLHAIPEAPHSRVFAPTILLDVTQKMRIFNEETFGPVITVMSVEDDDEAAEIANNSKFGLTSAIITSSPSRASYFAEKVRSGMVYMNRSDYMDPYLVWTGANTNSGTGASMGASGFHSVTVLKGIHFRKQK